MILITGASGNNGSEIIRILAQQGLHIRAMTRRQHDPTRTSESGIEFVTGDFDEAESIRRALDGLKQAFLVTPSSERVEEQQFNFVEAARAAAVRHLVYLSQLHAAKDSPVRFLRYHAVVEDTVNSSGMTFTHIRPNLFMQGLLAFVSTDDSNRNDH